MYALIDPTNHREGLHTLNEESKNRLNGEFHLGTEGLDHILSTMDKTPGDVRVNSKTLEYINRMVKTLFGEGEPYRRYWADFTAQGLTRVSMRG